MIPKQTRKWSDGVYKSLFGRKFDDDDTAEERNGSLCVVQSYRVRQTGRPPLRDCE